MPDEIAVEFDAATQSLDAIHAAAYRMIGIATCQIAKEDSRIVCRITLARGRSNDRAVDLESVRQNFLDCVTDENLRERISAKTDPVRNVILCLTS